MNNCIHEIMPGTKAAFPAFVLTAPRTNHQQSKGRNAPWYWSGFLLLLTLLSGCSEPPYVNLNNDQLKIMLEQNVAIFDIRRPEEWRQTGVIEGSQLLTFVDASGRIVPDFLGRFTSAVGKDDPVILVCRTGNRTSTLARHLVEEMGYTQVFNVRNGITQWIGDKRPVTRQ